MPLDASRLTFLNATVAASSDGYYRAANVWLVLDAPVPSQFIGPQVALAAAAAPALPQLLCPAAASNTCETMAQGYIQVQPNDATSNFPNADQLTLAAGWLAAHFRNKLQSIIVSSLLYSLLSFQSIFWQGTQGASIYIWPSNVYGPAWLTVAVIGTTQSAALTAMEVWLCPHLYTSTTCTRLPYNQRLQYVLYLGEVYPHGIAIPNSVLGVGEQSEDLVIACI
jgi:hypothetical protein